MSTDAAAVQRQIETFINGEIKRAMEPYRALGLPADVLAEMETMLRIGLQTHPTAQAILRALATDPTVTRSDQIDMRDIEEAIRLAREGEQ